MRDAKPVIVCADDFAQTPVISEGILQLADSGRLSAVSCFADSPLWPTVGPQLLNANPTLLVGLHFNLTHPFGHDEKPLRHWLLRSLTGSIDFDAVHKALQRQIDRFCVVAGRPPDFVDGHEHVHAFPHIRNVIADQVVQHADLENTCIRDVAHLVGATDAPLKRRVIRTMARLGRGPRTCRALNTGFGGDYSLTPQAPYEALFAGWLAAAPPGSLIMCHPQAPRPATAATARDVEYAYLASPRFTAALDRSRTALVRRSDELPCRSMARRTARRSSA